MKIKMGLKEFAEDVTVRRFRGLIAGFMYVNYPQSVGCARARADIKHKGDK